MKYSKKNILIHLSKHIKIDFKLMMIYGIASSAIIAISLVTPYLNKILVDDIMRFGNIELLKWVVISMIFVFISKLGLLSIKTYMGNKIKNLVLLDIQKKLINKIINQNIGIINKSVVGDFYEKIETDTLETIKFLLSNVVNTFILIISSVIYVTLMFSINWFLGISVTIFIPLSFIFSKIIGEKYNKINKEKFDVRVKLRNYLFNSIQCWHEIKINTQEENFIKTYTKKLEPEKKLNKTWMRLYALRDLVYLIKSDFILNILLYFIGGLLIILNHISLGQLLMFMSYTVSLSANIDEIMKSHSDFIGQKEAFDRIFNILNINNHKNTVDVPDAPKISLSKVCFSFEKTQKEVLNNICCNFNFGCKYLIVGKSGEGKSTLIKLILGIYKAQQGSIKISNIDINNINEHQYFKNVGVVMQDTAFLNISIRDNLQLIASKVTDEDIKRALKLACIDDYIYSLPNKLDTVIGERGIKLSGGQKQRLAIAKLILHNPQIIILDEATSALDPITESVLIENIYSFFHNKTIIIISHKDISDYKKNTTLIINNKTVNYKEPIGEDAKDAITRVSF